MCVRRGALLSEEFNYVVAEYLEMKIKVEGAFEII